MHFIRRSSTKPQWHNFARSSRGSHLYWRRFARAAFGQFSNLCGNSVFQALQRGRVLVICYHSVVPDDTPDPHRLGNVVTTSEFAAHLEILTREFDPISAADLSAWYSGSAQLPRRPVLVTLDDGYRNNLTYAAPLLLHYGVPALMFVTTGYIATERRLWPYEVQERILSWSEPELPLPSGNKCELPRDSGERYLVAQWVREECKNLPFEQTCAYRALLTAAGSLSGGSTESGFLTWDDVRELVRLGFEIGSHTVEHPILSHVSPERLWDEVQLSKKTIEHELSMPCRYFAYPNGRARDITIESEKALRQAQYSFAFTTIPGFWSASENPFRLGRVVIPDHASVDMFHRNMLQSTVKGWLAVA